VTRRGPMYEALLSLDPVHGSSTDSTGPYETYLAVLGFSGRDSPRFRDPRFSAELVARVCFSREIRCFRPPRHGRRHGLKRRSQVHRVSRTRRVIRQEVRIELGHARSALRGNTRQAGRSDHLVRFRHDLAAGSAVQRASTLGRFQRSPVRGRPSPRAARKTRPTYAAARWPALCCYPGEGTGRSDRSRR
jgi:hypothetical protein